MVAIFVGAPLTGTLLIIVELVYQWCRGRVQLIYIYINRCTTQIYSKIVFSILSDNLTFFKIIDNIALISNGWLHNK